MSQLQFIGTIVRPHGLRGDLLVTLQHPINLTKGARVWIGFSHSFGREYTLESYVLSGRNAIIHLASINSRAEAEQFREHGIFVSDVALATDNTSPLFGISGWKVLDMQGNVIGSVVGTEDNPAHPLLLIECNDGNEILLPYVSEFIVGIDRVAQTLTVNPPAGLLDL